MYLLIELRKSQLAFGFEEGEHPREAVGQHEGKYKPGEFVPKGQSGEPLQKERRAYEPKGKTGNPNRIIHQSEEFVNEDIHALLEDVGLRKFVSAGATEEDFEFHAKHSLQALRDLAEVLGLADGDVSFNGKLGMGVGDLGQKMLAQYSGMSQIITVAKARATGSLCHEWFHAFDNLSNEQMGASELRRNNWSTNYKKFSSTPVGQAFGNLVGVLMRSTHRNHGAMVSDAMTNIRLDDGTPYWSYMPEVAARAFEAYVCDKLEAAGKSNDYLVDSRRVNRGEGLKGLPLYPEGKDRVTINAAFDALWEAVAADKQMMKSLGSKPMPLTVGLFLDLDKARKVKVQPGQLGLWLEEEHPRKPAGSEGGGEFTKKEGADLGEPVENGPTYRSKFNNLEFKVTHKREPTGEGTLPVYTGTVTKEGSKGFAKFKVGDQHSASAIQLVNHYDRIEGEPLGKPEEKKEDPNVLHTFTNEADGTKAVVARNTGVGGGFIVSLHDTDAGEPIGYGKIYTVEGEAIKEAKNIVGHKDEVSEETTARLEKLRTALDDVRLQAQSRRGTMTRAAEFLDLPADEQVEYFNQIILPIYHDTGEPTKGEGRYLEFQDRVAAHFRNGGQMDAEEVGGASLGANSTSGGSKPADTGKRRSVKFHRGSQEDALAAAVRLNSDVPVFVFGSYSGMKFDKQPPPIGAALLCRPPWRACGAR
jgi:hypothetical protein